MRSFFLAGTFIRKEPCFLGSAAMEVSESRSYSFNDVFCRKPPHTDHHTLITRGSLKDVVQSFAKPCLQGIVSGLAALDQLLVLLKADKTRALEDQHGGIAETLGVAGQAPVVEARLEDRFTENDQPMDWMDQIAMSMGTSDDHIERMNCIRTRALMFCRRDCYFGLRFANSTSVASRE
ncbi:hypothetical protein P175DRAFT_0553010 [Aspergillus ochraceoroseus IBT 24754]|uniref:Uncharacterized protein n=1 Tax=Aspergillus ochraceoroseus IBT 24754 TaxID=1392256 RepID=A0A2T5M574_9EURO|nr:uncharacterized protein P175DRAFT_0553010 [Aspergillus ochraceoroseus IBT 24754]PTU23698.1 hypothetical protein P175DRAFT_0553010 [Aspergillus ochraceoroseus IBT 24754]